MNKSSTFILVSVISLFASASGFCDKTQETASPQHSLQDSAKTVEYFENELNFKTNPYGTKQVVDGKIKNVTIVDVRDAKSFSEGHIPGAINLPYDKSSDNAEAEIPGLRKDGFNYIYCYEHLCNLSQKAAKKFAALGYPVKEIVGGFEAWKEHKYPVEK